MFDPDRHRMRHYFCEVFDKARTAQPLEPLEQLIAQVIAAHPEYHSLLSHAETAQETEFGPENPFLHLSLHIALHEQLGTQRPPQILSIYQRLCQRLGDTHTAEHRMMECLGKTLWEAQRNGQAPDERVYTQRLQRLLR